MSLNINLVNHYLVHIEVQLQIMRLCETSWVFVRFCEISWQFYEISWDFMRFYEISWDFMRFHEILWDFMTFYEICDVKVFGPFHTQNSYQPNALLQHWYSPLASPLEQLHSQSVGTFWAHNPCGSNETWTSYLLWVVSGH